MTVRDNRGAMRLSMMSCTRYTPVVGAAPHGESRAPSVIGTAARAVLRTLSLYDIDGRELAKAAGVPPEVFEDADARLPSATLSRFIAMAAAASGDDVFALKFAEHHREISQSLYFAMAASETLIDAWRRLMRFRRMVGDSLDLEQLASADDEVHIGFTVPEPDHDVARWIPTDVMAGTHVIGARAFTMSPDVAPLRMDLRRPRPRALQAFESLFRCPMRFGRDRSVIVWSTETAQRPLPLANPRIAMQSEGVVVDYLSRRQSSEVTDRVRRLVVAALPDGLPQRDVIARRLGLSSRNLARGLAAEGTTFRDLVNEVRYELARDYLASGATITEIAFLLGFSETSAFTRAFRRWTGETPTAYATNAKMAG